jgi:hypothetical protein
MLSSPACNLAPELQTSEIPEGFMKHPVYLKSYKTVKSVVKYINKTSVLDIHNHTKDKEVCRIENFTKLLKTEKEIYA